MPMLSAVFRRASALPALMALSLLAACSSAPVAPAALYDFGLAPAASAGARLPTALRVADVAGPGWMDGNAIYYRLAYAQGQRTDAYANSRWVESPVSLFDARLRNAAAGRGQVIGYPTPDVPSLRVELVDFSQVFDRPDASRGVVRLRATVSLARGVIDQRVVQADAPAPSPDAAGGVAALTQASDKAIGEVLDWVAALPLAASAPSTPATPGAALGSRRR
ncbi:MULTISPECIES: ABC-type transport auxiliary lipoprotein family protein [Ralstonia]|jgi:cholesterol transport system auxiliary component|uniref:ABC-type transport auxiliary lipoprotein component domain-containing protein n=3 Tax=Pseudomonadota TaxID=1224 RepID=A0ABM9IQX4_RALPI|nr:MULTISPECIES: ABC-type transport auxiliary lipoprotein family protein [Ralstonia]MBA4200861.1 ABC transporter [Ralstonia sp.]MBA4230664.1 ABC transporter [Ralstonia sp.]MBA4238203.1 ABC transporter [Ralstonia sp.]MBA4279311.1 ABC transporter [Ralstonia sp.]MBA4295113.1 ABC transporter [Ralstonia sp.]